jgi:TatA/E family protein of Tat protein translocase
MNLGMPEMIFLFLLALVLFGPKKLPQIGRELGKALSDFKRASSEFKNQLETEIQQVEIAEREKAGSSPASEITAFPVDPMQQPVPQPIPGETIEPRILPPSEPTVASTFGQSAETELHQPKSPVVDSAHDPNLTPSNQTAVQGENASAITTATLRESNA